MLSVHQFCCSKVFKPINFFSSFQTNVTVLTTNKCEKCPSSIQCWDSNPRPRSYHNHYTRAPALRWIFYVAHVQVFFSVMTADDDCAYSNKFGTEFINQLFLVIRLVHTKVYFRNKMCRDLNRWRIKMNSGGLGNGSPRTS